jgi:hypothetical protein
MHAMRPTGGVLLLSALMLGIGIPANAQRPLYAGGTVGCMTLTQSATEQQLGGATCGGSVVFGVQVSPQLGVEFEPTFGGDFLAQEYTYRPSPSLTARVVGSGSDTFFTFQVRWKVGVLEPVAGISYVREQSIRHAPFVPGDRTYFHDEQSGGTFAFAGGIDAAVRIAPHLYFVPSFRVFVLPSSSSSFSTGPPSGRSFVLRYGAGGRLTF